MPGSFLFFFSLNVRFASRRKQIKPSSFFKWAIFVLKSRADTHFHRYSITSEKQNSVTLHFSIEPIGMRIVSPTTFFESSCCARDF